MAIGADEKHGMAIDAEEKQHVAINEIFKFEKQTELEKCFESYKPVGAVLCCPRYTIHDFSEIVTVMENLGFSLLDSSDDWRQFGFTKGLESINISKDTPRLPFAKLEACHPCVYKLFLEDVCKWIGRELTSKSLRIGVILLSNEVKGSNGLFPTTWRKEKHRLWYKYDSLDTKTKERSLKYKWSEEYRRDLTGCDQDKLEDRETELQNLITILNYEQGVREEWKRCKLVTLWDVQSSRVIRTYEQLNAILEKIGFKPEKLSDYVGFIEKTSAAGVTRYIYPKLPVRRFSWLYEDTTAQSYSYCPHRISKESFPWLPHPCMVGCHPLTYFLFLQKVEKCIGREATKKTFGIRGIPLGLIPKATEALGDGENYYKTVWKGFSGFKYKRSLLLSVLWEELEGLLVYMKEAGVRDSDIKLYYADAAHDTRNKERPDDEELEWDYFINDPANDGDDDRYDFLLDDLI